MLRFLNIGRMITFLVTLLTTIPLFINFLSGQDPDRQLIVNLHVWFGLAFFVFAIVSLVLQKKSRKNSST